MFVDTRKHLMQYTFLPMDSHYSPDLQVAVMCHETQQHVSKRKGRRSLMASKYGCKQCGFQNVKTQNIGFANVLWRNEMHSTRLLDLRNIYNEFW